MTSKARPRRRSIPQMLFYAFCRDSMALLLRFVFGLRAEGKERIPRNSTQGGVLIVANHQSYFDPPIVGVCIGRRQFHPLAREGLFRAPVFGWMIRALNAVPVRGGGADTETLRAMVERLREGGVVCLFPEGARTPDGEIHTFKPGAMLLVKRAECVVVPAAIDGAYEVWPRHRALPRLFGPRLRVRFGEPISAKELLEVDARTGLARLENEVRRLAEVVRAERGARP